jgi:hypothetical protein
MPRYEVTYFRGHDHDDWDKAQFNAVDADEAKQKALDVIPPGHRVKRIKPVQTVLPQNLGQDQDGYPVDPFGMRDAFDNLCEQADKIIQTHNTMEQTTKIQNITPQGTFDYNGKTFHKFDVILENGMVGEVNAMTPDKWKEGDECVVKEQNTTKWGPRLKLDKPGFSGGGSSSPKAPANNDVKGIVASWAVACAMQAAGDPFQKDYDSIVLQLARVALSARKVIKDEVEV